MKKLIFLALFVFSGIASVYAQDDKEQLEKERQDIQQELDDLQKAYNQVKGQKNVTLGELNVLRRKVQVQERYLNNINREIRYLNDDIYRSTLEIIKMRKQLDTLKAQYARSVIYAYKNRSTYDFLNFIFSATNFNDALKRIAYLKSYRSYREQQVNSIKETAEAIEQRKRLQISQMEEKKEAVANQAKQVKVLEDQRREKNVAVNELKSKEKDIKKQIATKQKRDRDIKNAILGIVRRETKKAEEEAKARAKANNTNTSESNPSSTSVTPSGKPKSYLDLNAEDVKLNASFETNKGKLPWPVDNGFVSIHFGRYEIEGTSLKGDNPGITIATPSVGIPVKSVFQGEVAAVANLGDGMMVTIRHGKYFTTYSNLTSVNVNKGTQVSTGEVIGKTGVSDDGSGGQIDFILMIESKNVNPEPWLRRR